MSNMTNNEFINYLSRNKHLFNMNNNAVNNSTNMKLNMTNNSSLSFPPLNYPQQPTHSMSTGFNPYSNNSNFLSSYNQQVQGNFNYNFRQQPNSNYYNHGAGGYSNNPYNNQQMSYSSASLYSNMPYAYMNSRAVSSSYSNYLPTTQNCEYFNPPYTYNTLGKDIYNSSGKNITPQNQQYHTMMVNTTANITQSSGNKGGNLNSNYNRQQSSYHQKALYSNSNDDYDDTVPYKKIKYPELVTPQSTEEDKWLAARKRNFPSLSRAIEAENKNKELVEKGLISKLELKLREKIKILKKIDSKRLIKQEKKEFEAMKEEMSGRYKKQKAIRKISKEMKRRIRKDRNHKKQRTYLNAMN
jgi:hypothetical protein